MISWSDIWVKLAAIGAAIAALLAAVFTIFKKGETSGAAGVQVKDAKVTQDSLVTAQAARQQTANTTEQAQRDDLAKNWTKP